jgi:hypothetical protein
MSVKEEPMNKPTKAVAKTEKQVTYQGEAWNVVSLGVTNDDGRTYAHLSHPTRGRLQKNGFVPEQVCDWIESYSKPPVSHD